MPKNYKHDVDIRSSQAGRAAKDAKKFLEVYLGVPTIIILIWSGISFVQWQIEKAETRDEIKNAPRINLSAVANDYIQNKMRYEEKWTYKWFTYSGQISSISDGEVSFNGWIPTTKSLDNRFIMNCKVYPDKTKDFTTYNVGSLITITGKFYWAQFNINKGMNGLWTFHFDSCMVT